MLMVIPTFRVTFMYDPSGDLAFDEAEISLRVPETNLIPLLEILKFNNVKNFYVEQEPDFGNR